jgi:hypothetical protein
MQQQQDGRMFTCRWCALPTVVCGGCDRGQSYCCCTCRHSARHASTKRAQKRYWRSHKGKMQASKRKQTYRQARKFSDQKGTDHPKTQACDRASVGFDETRANIGSQLEAQEDLAHDVENHTHSKSPADPVDAEGHCAGEQPSCASCTQQPKGQESGPRANHPLSDACDQDVWPHRAQRCCVCSCPVLLVRVSNRWRRVAGPGRSAAGATRCPRVPRAGPTVG